MIKRPLDPRFGEAVLAGRKTTTIRPTAWPCNVPILLFHWSGAPYRSKHIDLAPVIVSEVLPITISHREDGRVTFSPNRIGGRPLYETEGHATRSDLDAWFRKVVKRGGKSSRFLMRFSLADPATASKTGGR